MSSLESIRPNNKLLVFDLVEHAGLDMSDWIASSNDHRGPKANPKYCYEWSFVEPGQVVILNLWHEAMTMEVGEIVQRGNFRADALSHRGPTGKAQWFARATKLDNALKTALRDNLPVRVIINQGRRRKLGDPSTVSSKVLKRELDAEPWTIVEYDWKTGAHAIRRGITGAVYVDQFDLDQSEKAEALKKERTGSTFIRDPKVRDDVKRRSKGTCEHCGKAGFEMASGAVYLETHHIVPLSEGGPDTVGNVIALCPLDHRRAHYAHDAAELRVEMQIAISRILERADKAARGR